MNLMTFSSRRFLLRDRTSLSHARVEALVGSFDTLDAYRRYLRGTYVFRAALDRSMSDFSWPAEFYAWQDADDLSTLVLQDLWDLNVDVPPHHSSEPLLSDPETLFGTLYVVEGSSLGARILYRRAQELGLSAEYGARHLAVQSASSDRWKQLIKLLDEAPHLDLDRTVRASEATFAAVGRAFEELENA